MQFKVLAPLALFLVACSCQSVQGREYASGMKRASLDFSYADGSAEDEFGTTLDYTNLRASGGLGYFVAPQIELGGSIALTSQESQIGNLSVESDVFALGGDGRFYFMTSGPIRPFGAVGVGLLTGSSGSTDIDGFYYGLALGIATFVTETTTIDFGIQKLWSDQTWYPGSGGSFSVDEDVLALTVGVSFLF